MERINLDATSENADWLKPFTTINVPTHVWQTIFDYGHDYVHEFWWADLWLACYEAAAEEGSESKRLRPASQATDNRPHGNIPHKDLQRMYVEDHEGQP